jgi:glycosyltransferase involved in cell wall biosynthesis
MKISIIIPTLNEEAFIEKTLSALKPQLEEGDEIIVVDSYSTDHTTEIARSFGVKVVFIERCGIGPAKTFGAKFAKNEVIAMLDADGVPFPDWLKRIKMHFKNESTNAVSGYGFYYGSTKPRIFLYNLFGLTTFQIGRLGHKLKMISWIPPNDCAIRKDLFFKYGGLCNVVCEDFHFAKNAKRLGNVKYDSKLNVTLSDRRFKKEGFKKVLLLWLVCNFAIITNKHKIAATDYSIIR